MSAISGAAALGVVVWAATLRDGLDLAAACLLGWTLLALAVIDARRHILPDFLTLPLAAAGIGFAFIDGVWPIDRMLGAVLGYAAFASVAFLYRRWRGRDGLGMGDAKLMAAAGADMIFVSSLETPEEMRKVCAAVPRPVKINVIEGNPPAKYTMSELFSFGFRLVGYAGILQRAAGKAMQACIETFRREETTEGGLRDLLMTTAERYEVLDVAYYKALEKRLAESLATEK